MRVGCFAEALTRVDKGRVSRAVKAPIGRSLVTRVPHPADSQVMPLPLTHAGEEPVGRMTPFARGRHRRPLAGRNKGRVCRF